MSYIFLHNAKIWTGNPDIPFVQAMIINGNTISAIGKTKDLQNIISDDIIEFDLKGKTILPGFTDSHLHLSEWAKREKQLKLDSFDSLAEVLEYIENNIPDSEWILGGGWNHNLWKEKRLPTLEDLSFVSPLQKVVFFSKDFHSVWINESVIDMINPKDLAKYIDMGQIEVNSIGQLTGIFKEEAMMKCIVPLVDSQPSPIFTQAVELFENFYKYGITSVHTMETLTNYRKFRNLYQNRVHRGPRLSVYIYHQDKDNVLDYNMKSGDGGYWLRFMGLKYFLDGALGSQTAWLQKAYENSNSLGIQLWKKDDIRKELTDIRNNNTIKVAIHAIGDAAFDEALDLFENSNFYNDIPDRIEHGQLCNEEILEKLKNRKLGICTNPSHLLSDFPTAEKYWGERSRYAFALKSLEKSGQIITMGSDAPVESINPWLGIMAAVYRVPQYSGIPWYAEECISLESALKMNTYNPAILSGEKNKKGLLMPGYLADLFVCSKDPFNAEMADMQSIRSLLTIIDGQVVYNRLSNLI